MKPRFEVQVTAALGAEIVDSLSVEWHTAALFADEGGAQLYIAARKLFRQHHGAPPELYRIVDMRNRARMAVVA